MFKVKLVKADRYSFRGETFLRGEVNIVSEEKAIALLRSKDDYGRPFFVDVSDTPAAAPAKPSKAAAPSAPAKPMTAAQKKAAAKAAAKADSAPAPVVEDEEEEEQEEDENEGGPSGNPIVEV